MKTLLRSLAQLPILLWYVLCEIGNFLLGLSHKRQDDSFDEQ